MTVVRTSTPHVLLLVFLMVLLALPSSATAQITDINTAINKAGRERMLSQRMAKVYFQLGQDVDTQRSQRILDTSLAQFDRQLVELKNYAPNDEIRKTYLELEQTWIPLKDLLVGTTPQLENAHAVLELSDRVLALAHQGTNQLEALAETGSGYLVNRSGHLRFMSQRMARNYQAISWGVQDEVLEDELNKVRAAFVAALNELSEHPDNTLPVKSRLELLRQQWYFFESALDERRLDDQTLATSVATTSERILEMAEEIVELYEAML